MEAQQDRETIRVLQSNHWLLCSVLDVEEILPGALVKGLLSEEEGKMVESTMLEQGSNAGVAKMLELLLHKPQKNSFNLFLEVLDEKEDLRPWASYLRSDYELEVQDGCVMPDSNGLPECSTLVKQSSACDLEDGCVMPDSNGLPEWSTLVKQSSDDVQEFPEHSHASSVIQLLMLPSLRLLADFNKMQDCSVETVNRLLQVYSGVCKCRNVLDADKKSLLHIACKIMDFKVVKMMVEEFSFDPNIQDVDGNTALHIACQAQKAQTVIYLLNLPTCDPNIRNRQGMTALHCASQTNCHSVTQFLLNSNRIDERIKDEVRKYPVGVDLNSPVEKINRINGNLRTEAKVFEAGDETRAYVENSGEYEVEHRRHRPDNLNSLLVGLDGHNTSTMGLINMSPRRLIVKNAAVERDMYSRSCICCCCRRKRNAYMIPQKKYQRPLISLRLLEMVKNTFFPFLGILLGLAIIAALAYFLHDK